MANLDLYAGIKGSNAIDQWEIDKTFLAARVALRPLEYAKDGVILGSYRVAQASGAVVSIGALGHVGSIRWSDSTRYLVLMRIRAGYTITTAVTAAPQMDMRAIIARGFTVDFTTAATAIDMATIAKTGAMRSTMSSSLMGANGPRICTTTVQSGQTMTVDAAPIAMVCWEAIHMVNATGTAVLLGVGSGGPMMDLYNCNANGEHPVVLSANEGVILQPVTAGPTTGTMKYYFEWTWSEVHVF